MSLKQEEELGSTMARFPLRYYIAAMHAQFPKLFAEAFLYTSISIFQGQRERMARRKKKKKPKTVTRESREKCTNRYTRATREVVA